MPPLRIHTSFGALGGFIVAGLFESLEIGVRYARSGDASFTEASTRSNSSPKDAQSLKCDEPGCQASVIQTGTILGKASYRCSAGHEFTR